MKGGVVTLYQRIITEHKRLSKQIETIKQDISSLPEGKLIVCHHGTRCKWYQSDGHKKTYIPKANAHLAMQLARKKYLTLKLKDLENEKRSLDFYLQHHSSINKADTLLTEPSEYQNLLTPQFTDLPTEISNWLKSPYEQNLSHPERLIYKSISGHLLRSKSEMLIDILLYQHQLPFRYECALNLGETMLHPDFTIRHPTTGEYYYWEHFGLMEQPTYAANVFSKLKLYTEYGIIPGIHLITTYETQEHPLSTEMVEKIIEYYFS